MNLRAAIGRVAGRARRFWPIFISPEHARLVEERVDRGFGAGERGGMRRRGATPSARPATL